MRHLLALCLFASAALGISPAVAAAQTSPSVTIASAQQLTIGDQESGGGHRIDFWLVRLVGGDQLQFTVNQTNFEGLEGGYDFQLYAPGTTDSSFPTTPAVDSTGTNGSPQDAVTLQAPY
ncbi:MAG: hypothetical protein ACLP50_19725, partial [Solirubrobacteraceae bacterium]